MLTGKTLELPEPPRTDAFFVTKKGAPVALPLAPAPIADAHTHLSSLRSLDPALALARAAVAGVRFVVDVVDPTDDARDPQALLADIERWQAGAAMIVEAWGNAEVLDALGEKPLLPKVRLVVGCHPHNASAFNEGARQAMEVLLAQPICAGVGEIGLDYHYDLSPREVQRTVFEEQLKLARAVNAPLSLHIREAHHEAAPLMERVGLPGAGAVLHCFDLGPEDAAPFQAMGCVLGLGGAVTFKRNEPTRVAAAAAPLGGIVTETDAPYMAPEPLRGTSCEPAMTALTMDFLAKLRAEHRGEDPAEFYESAYRKARELFDGPAPLGGARA